jgi:hypothetical protein
MGLDTAGIFMLNIIFSVLFLVLGGLWSNSISSYHKEKEGLQVQSHMLSCK